MLEIIIPGQEFWDESKHEFVETKSHVLQIEHSLVSISKWESKWEIPFLAKQEKTTEQVLDYIKCMTITQNVNPEVYKNLQTYHYEKIKKYIDAKMTATWFTEKPVEGAVHNVKEVITAEIIYHWMIVNNIPIEFQKWHLNKLLTLIRVCSIKNNPPKKMSRKEMLAHRKALNDSRRSGLNTRG